MTFAVGGALLASSVSVGAVATQPEKEKGTLIITKKVVNDDSADLTDIKFTIGWDCTGGDSSKNGDAWKKGTVYLADGESHTVEDIPTGKTCTVTEEEPKSIPYFGWETSYDPMSSIEISKVGEEITVTNTVTRDRGELKIAKTLDDDSEPYTGEFSINYSCEPVDDVPGTAVSGAVTVAVGGSGMAKIPTGFACVVTETTFPSVPGFAWSAAQITGSPTEAINDKVAQEVTVENLLTVAPTPPPPPPTPPAPAPAPAPAAAAPPAAGTVPETIPAFPLTPVVPAPGTGVSPTAPVTSVEPAAGTGVPASVNAGGGPAPSNGIPVAMWLVMIAAISAAVTWGLTRWTDTEGDTHMQKVHME